MNVLVLRTNIESSSSLTHLEEAFSSYRSIHRWTVDLEDTDRVLRIETSGVIREREIIEIVNDLGYECQDLPE